MYLIADSGSTKCDWILLDKTGEFILKAQTKGLNPDMLTTQMMRKRVAKCAELAHVSDEVTQIYFYGAGCGTEKNRIRLERFLKKYFRKANAEVHEDLIAACLAVTEKPGIVCILGTGSNACYFDGEATKTNSPSLGYMVMDEASGNYFGKHLLRDYFYKKMPDSVAKKFAAEFELYPHDIKERLYKRENPNAYLAAFSKFMFQEKPLHPYFEQLISDGLNLFFENHVLTFSEAKTQPIHFVGSIAYFSRDIILKILKEKNMALGNIVQHPVDGLADYFQQKIKMNKATDQ